MKVFLDTEFIEDGKTIDLISIGMVKEDGSEYYAVSRDYDPEKANDWVKENVLTKLDDKGGTLLRSRDQIMFEVLDFVGPDPEFWAYYADYDWVVLCQLFGTMMDLPKGWPMYCRDLQQKIDEGWIKPPEPVNCHNALDDAKWNKLVYDSNK